MTYFYPMVFTSSNLKKIENLLKEAGYALRYEKGNFNSGFCVLQDKKVVIINKYFTDDVKFQKLVDIIQSLEFKSIENLSDASKKILEKFLGINSNQILIPFEDEK